MPAITSRISKTPESIPFKGPVSFPSLAAARAALHAPADANYVIWDSSWPVNRDLEDVFNSLGANDILVLPERAQPYIVDSSEGFRASGVQSVTGRYGQVPIVNQYKGIRNARTWFAMARSRRGILGLGPNARIEMSNSGWTQEPQIQNAGNTHSDGWVSPGRYWTGTDGQVKSELIGAQEQIIESSRNDAYYGNFTLRGRDLGGVAYSGVTGPGATFERLDLTTSWRGFLSIPNGETGAISSTGASGYYITKCLVGTRDSSGTRLAPSPIMINSSGGGTIEDTDVSESSAGMLTLWRCSGKHILKNVHVRYNYGPGINMEFTQSGFELEWTGGSIFADYNGNGGRLPKPADQGSRGRMHLNLYATGTSAKITLRNVDIDNGLQPNAINVQTYGGGQAALQQASDIKCYAADGSLMATKLYY